MAPHGAPDNDRKMKEASWLTSQAFIESLRDYPDPAHARVIEMPGEAIAFTGSAHRWSRIGASHRDAL